MEDDPLRHAERQMAAYELEAMSALFAKLAERIGLDPTHPRSEATMQAALSELIEQDAEAAELSRTLLALKGRPAALEAQPGRPLSLGEGEDLADAQALYAVIEACRSVTARKRSHNGPGRLLREAIWTIWEQPRLPHTLLDGKWPMRYPWSPSARGTVATQTRRPQGLLVGHLYPPELLSRDLLEESNNCAATTVALVQDRIVCAVVTRQENRLLGSPGALTWDAFERDPWCRYRLTLPVEEFKAMETDG